MKSNGGVLSADEVVHQPITTVLSGPAAGALGAALIARGGRLRPGAHAATAAAPRPTSPSSSTASPTLTTEGTVGGYPSKIPMIDVVTVGAGGGSIAWISPEGTLKVGPRSAGADPGPLCYGRGGTEPTVTDAHLVLGRIPPHLLGGEIPLDVDAARAGAARPGRPARAEPGGVRGRHPGDLGVEPGQRAAPGHRQARPGRPRLHDGDVRRLGFAAGLPADRHPRAARRAGAARPRQRVGVRPADRRRAQRLRADRGAAGTRDLDLGELAPRSTTSCRRRPRGAGPGGLRAPPTSGYVRTRRPALLRPGVRGAGAGPDGPVDGGWADRVAATFHDAHERCTATASATSPPAGRVGQPAGDRGRPDRAGPQPRQVGAGTAAPDRPGPATARCASTSWSTPPVYWPGRTWRRRRGRPARR